MTGPRHLVWDWNGTLLDDVPLVMAATNAAITSAGGPYLTTDEHRRRFRRPIADFYADVLGRRVGDDELDRLDALFHKTYRAGVTGCGLVADARAALRSWPGTQSLLSMWFHAELIPTVDRYGLAELFTRIDGRRYQLANGEADRKGPMLAAHLAELGLDSAQVVVIGDTVDDAHAAAAVGAGCVLYGGGFTGPELLRTTGAPVADTLLEAVTLARAAGDRLRN